MVSTITGAGTGPQDLCLVNCSGILDKLAEISQEELSQVSPLGDKSSPTLVRYQKGACAAGLHLQQKRHTKRATETEERGQDAVPMHGLRDRGTSPRGGGPLEGSAV